MAWWEWVREFVGGVSERVETGLRELLGMPGEIEPYIPTRPATEEQIAEALKEAVYAERFIQEVELDQAHRLARGVRFYEPLRNVARMRHWTVADPRDIVPDIHTQISQRRVLIGPDGAMVHVDVAGGYGERYDEDLFLRKTASALPDSFVKRYDLPRTLLAQRYTVAAETYVQRHKPLPGR